MRRREFVTIVGGAAVAWPLAAGTQARSAWRIGMLQPDASSPSDPFVDAFRDGLRGLGYEEGRDILLEIRWAGGSNEPLFGLAVELVALKVDVLVTLSTPAAIAAKKATAIIPIVFTAVGDPVELASCRASPAREETPRASRCSLPNSARSDWRYSARSRLAPLPWRCCGMSCTRFRRHQVRCFMEQEVRYGEKAVYAGVQA
jgi:ABC transporter substrate binding protein